MVQEKTLAAGCWSGVGARHLTTIMLFLSIAVVYGARVAASLAVVAIAPELSWSRVYQDTFLSSFFWGYVMLQVPGGVWARRSGGKGLALGALAINALLSFVMPYAVKYGGVVGACACRAAQGASQGVLYPTIHTLLARWVPTPERARLSSFVYSGSQMGTVLELWLGGLVASNFGWPGAFWLAGVGCLVLSVIWACFGASAPSSCHYVSDKEREYIESHTASVDENDKSSTPWKAIWLSPAFWAILIAHCGQCLGFWTLLTETPSYLHNVLGLDIKTNGLVSALPYLAMFISSAVFSWSSDSLVNRSVFRRSTARKTFNTIAFWGPAACLVSLRAVDSVNGAVILLVLAVALNGANYAGFMLSHMDIAPRQAGALMGITNGISNLFSIAAPLLVTLFVQDEKSASQWSRVWTVAATVYVFAGLIFILLASADRQPWDAGNTGTREKKITTTNKGAVIDKEIKVV